MNQKMKCARASSFRVIMWVGLSALTLTMIGCQAGKNQGNPFTSPGVPEGTLPASAASTVEPQPVRGLAGPFVGSDKIISDMKAAGFSVADPKVKWGPTIYVDAEQASGGFWADAQEGLITLHWAKVADASSYEIFRSTVPVIPLMMETTLTMDAGQNSSDADNHWPDNKVVAGTTFYYFVLATTKNGGSSVVATGYGVTPAPGQPQTGLQGSGGAPGQVDVEAADRKAIRQKDGVTSLDMGQDASSAPRGTYGFAWVYDRRGDFLFYSENEPDRYAHPFEIHKLRNGKYTLVGFVDADTAKKTRENKSDFPLTVYAQRWTGATEIVSLPLERLSRYASQVGGNIEGTRRATVKTSWKFSSSSPDNDPSTQPVTAGRDTPAGAMNVFVQALEALDIATVADSFYMPEDTDGSCRHAQAMVYLHFQVLYRAVKERFGPEGTTEVFHGLIGIPPHKYSAEEFLVEPEPPHMAVTTPEAESRHLHVSLRRCDNGIWRIGGGHPLSAEDMESIRNNSELIESTDKYTWRVKVGKYATIEDLVSDMTRAKDIDGKMYKW